MVEYTLATGSKVSRANTLSSARLINFLVEKEPSGAKTQAALFGAPGLAAKGVCGAGPIRGLWNMRDELFVVSGAQLYKINIISGVSLLAGGLPGTGLVSMADNGTQLCIVLTQDGGAGYIWTSAGGLVQITSANYYPASTVTFMDGYFVFSRFATAEFFFSALWDGTTYSGIDFVQTDSTSTSLNGVATNLQLLFLFKGDAIEMWYDAGAADNPFQRYAGGVIAVGCVNPLSICKQDGALFFLGADHVTYRLQANTPIRVSTHEMETIFNGELTGKVNAFPQTVEGHKLVVFNLPDQQRTLVYDIATGEWHERISYDGGGASLGWWRASVGYDGNPLLSGVGDRYTGTVWNLNFGLFTEGAFPLPCTLVSGVLQKDRKRITLKRFELDVQPGVTATLYTSKDGGQTFTSRGSKTLLNAALDVLMRWTKLGSARQWVFKITMNDAAQRVLTGAYFDVDVGI